MMGNKSPRSATSFRLILLLCLRYIEEARGRRCTSLIIAGIVFRSCGRYNIFTSYFQSYVYMLNYPHTSTRAIIWTITSMHSNLFCRSPRWADFLQESSSKYDQCLEVQTLLMCDPRRDSIAVRVLLIGVAGTAVDALQVSGH